MSWRKLQGFDPSFQSLPYNIQFWPSRFLTPNSRLCIVMTTISTWCNPYPGFSLISSQWAHLALPKVHGVGALLVHTWKQRLLEGLWWISFIYTCILIPHHFFPLFLYAWILIYSPAPWTHLEELPNWFSFSPGCAVCIAPPGSTYCSQEAMEYTLPMVPKTQVPLNWRVEKTQEKWYLGNEQKKKFL